jgi:aryl-alcohol dehydrogenase-like predicted oxidoreductase
MLVSMDQRLMGPDGLAVSAVGLGCMGLSQGYGPADDDISVTAIRRGLDAGITLVDTAMSYGAGHNERLVGRAIAGRRDEVVVATKFGIVRDEAGVRLDARPEHVRGYCQESLSRLGTDAIDLYYLHRVDPEVPIGDTVAAMAELVAEGLVRHIGLSEVDAAQFEAASMVHPIAAIQVEWSLTWREPEDDIVPAAARRGTGVVCYSPLGRGLLTGALPEREFGAGDMRAGDGRFTQENLADNLQLVDAISRLAAEHRATAGQIALAWLLAQGPSVVPIPGSRQSRRIEENAAAASIKLSDADLARLESIAPRSAWAGDRRSFAARVTTRSSAGPGNP